MESCRIAPSDQRDCRRTCRIFGLRCKGACDPSFWCSGSKPADCWPCSPSILGRQTAGTDAIGHLLTQPTSPNTPDLSGCGFPATSFFRKSSHEAPVLRDGGHATPRQVIVPIRIFPISSSWHVTCYRLCDPFRNRRDLVQYGHGSAGRRFGPHRCSRGNTVS